MKNRIYQPMVLGLSLLFIVLNALLMIKDSYILLILPLAIFVLSALFFAPEKTFWFLVFLTPLSLPLSELVPSLNFDFWFPTEPLIVAYLAIIILKSFHDKFFDKHLANHPIFWALLFYLGWLTVTITTSEMPVVSIKYVLVRFWFIAVFFYLPYLFFRKNGNNYNRFFTAFLVGLSIIVVISIFKQSSRGLFNKFSAHGACNPFFPDHTSYGAALAFIIPTLFGFLTIAKTWWKKFLILILLIFFLVALILSYSRAAWLSLLVAGAVWFLWYIRIKLKTLIVGLAIVALVGLSFNDGIVRWLNGNQAASSGNLREHLRSTANIKTDDSNVERLNRWNSAVKMFFERPALGWGPGTYMFEYAPFQASYLKTPESSDLGTKGNAHSEYLGLLAETGLLGSLAYIIILTIVLYRGFKLLKVINSRSNRMLVLCALLGLITYIVHGAMNNFLDMDKIAAIFWGNIAFIIAMDIQSSQPKLEPKN